MRRTPKKIWVPLLILIYLFMLFFTYGYAKVHRGMKDEEAGVISFIWPIYWIVRGADTFFSTGYEWSIAFWKKPTYLELPK